MKSTLPRAVRELSQELSRLPGIGPKTAKRLSIHLLRQPHVIVKRFSNTLKNLHENVKICQKCYSLSENDICNICSDDNRDRSVLCVVESPLDVEAIEKTETYNGLFHVLGGSLSPLEGISSDQLTISELTSRLHTEDIKEIIFALNPTLEGDATVRHIIQQIQNPNINITKLGRGLPTGGDIEFTDSVTLSAAFKGRQNL